MGTQKMVGRFGKATKMANKPLTKSQEATLGAYLMYIPSAHLFWRHYMICVIHLRDIEGANPAVKQYPEATHELLVAALNPDYAPDPNDPETIHTLRPLNVVVQFTVPKDEDAQEILTLAARACVDGRFLVEPEGILGARGQWVDSIRATAEYYTNPEKHKKGDGN